MRPVICSPFFIKEVTDHDECETPSKEVSTDKKVKLV